MKIEKENIDIVFFDYYEGNLNESEKEALMNFLHQHPELNDDFTFWAQSYVHKHELPEDYKIAGKLVRGKKGITPGKITGFVAVTALIVLMFFWPQSPATEKVSVPMKEEGNRKESTLPEISSKSLNASKEEKDIKTQDNNKESGEKLRMPVPLINERTVLQNEKETKNNDLRPNGDLFMHPVPISNERIVLKDENETMQEAAIETDQGMQEVSADIEKIQDTLIVEPEKSENETEVSEERKPSLKKMRKLNLRPNPDIIPVNPDL